MKLFAYLRPKSILLAPTIFIFSKNIGRIRCASSALSLLRKLHTTPTSGA